MKAHLVIAHPEKNSFNFALHNTAVATLSEKNTSITTSDLSYQEFTAVAGPRDIDGLPTQDNFNLARAQRWALKNNAFAADIEQEQQKLLDSDLLILQFPLWWWSFPAQLKGWIDRVFSSGFAYGENALLKPKKVMFSVTTGGASSEEELAYYQKKIDGLYQDIFGFIGWQILPAFIAHGVQTISENQRINLLEEYQKHLLINCYT